MAIEPMKMPQAIEVIKILSPYAPEFTKHTKKIKVMRAIMENVLKDSPILSLRLIALMEHKSLEAIADELKEADGVELIARMNEGFERNDLQLLIDAAYVFRMSEAHWELTDGRE